MLSLLAVLIHMAPGHGRDRHEEFGHCTNKAPPKWNPDYERDYPFERWVQDVSLWALGATELDDDKIGPAVALALGGSARSVAREMEIATLRNGRFDQAAQRAFTGLECLLENLERQFGLLPQEQQISAISEYLNFKRKTNESTDETITRNEMARVRARQRGQFHISPSGAAWILLNTMHIPLERWPILLAPSQGNLPHTEPEYHQFLQYLRRNGHLYDRGQGNPQKTVNQPFFTTAEGTASSSFYAGYSESSEHEPYSGFGSSFVGFGASRDDADDVSSCHSGDDDPVDLHEFQSMSVGAALESCYLQYRHAKRQWRKMNPGGSYRFRRNFNITLSLCIHSTDSTR
jgi:hypothetical protein